MNFLISKRSSINYEDKNKTKRKKIIIIIIAILLILIVIAIIVILAILLKSQTSTDETKTSITTGDSNPYSGMNLTYYKTAEKSSSFNSYAF
jgi:flagellar basal body-associated protein FliL